MVERLKTMLLPTFERSPDSPLPRILWDIVVVLYYGYTTFVLAAITFKVCVSPWVLAGSGLMAWAMMTGLKQGVMYARSTAYRYTEKPIRYWFGVLVAFGGVVSFLIIGMGWR